jgi:undecaprenyl phosphate N,N'-diacetylbacillosamine 1-phosphate transferase
MYKFFFKGIIDFFVSVIGIFVLSPLFILVMILLCISTRQNPFFIQARPGKNSRIFRIIKFKTMSDKVDAEGNLLPDADRLTTIGRIVRKTSLDELPQLLNVLIGDMSFVGPRPLLPEYLDRYDDIQKRRHEVKPGITGLAQVKGRNKVMFSERLKLDVYYVDHVSLLLDLRIIFQTIFTVLFRSNTVRSGSTVEEVDDIDLSKNLYVHRSKNNV